VKRIYVNWRLKCGENRRLKLTVVGESGPKCLVWPITDDVCNVTDDRWRSSWRNSRWSCVDIANSRWFMNWIATFRRRLRLVDSASERCRCLQTSSVCMTHYCELSYVWVSKSISRWRQNGRNTTAARAWNALTSSVRSAPSLLQFRHDLKTSLFQSSYSSP